MTQIIKCIHNYLHTANESLPHFIYICLFLPSTIFRAVLKCPLNLCVWVKCQTLERLITATLAWWSVAGLCRKAGMCSMFETTWKRPFLYLLQKLLLLSLGDIWKACPWNVNHSRKEIVEWEILQKQIFQEEPVMKAVMKIQLNVGKNRIIYYSDVSSRWTLCNFCTK